jgi:hypothetical protein
MAHDSRYNPVGAGEKPRLGVGKPEGLARPGKGEMAPSGSDMDIPKVARPGGAEGGNRSEGSIPKVARPGGPESANK